MNASGFSKEIQELNDVLDEMNEYDQENPPNLDSEKQQREHQSDDDSSTDEEQQKAEKAARLEERRPVKEAKVAEPCKTEAIVENACASELIAEESETYDKFEDNMHYLNKKYRPYRDATEAQDNENDSDDNSDTYSCTTTTSTIMDPNLVRAKVRKSLLAKMKTEKRRIRNKGESALVTEKMREINDTIKCSLHLD